jgi:hypothetical protein
MPRHTRPPEGLFAERLDRLFRTVHPKDRRSYTPAEVAEAINETAGERVVSGTYLWLLRTGQRDDRLAQAKRDQMKKNQRRGRKNLASQIPPNNGSDTVGDVA